MKLAELKSSFLSFAGIWLMMSVLLFLPAYFWNVANVPEDCLVYRIIHLSALCILLTLVPILIAAIVKVKFINTGKILAWLSFIAVLLISFGETFMIKFFHTRYSAFIFQLVDETTGRESREFVFAYCSTFKFWAILFLYGFFTALAIGVTKYGKFIIQKVIAIFSLVIVLISSTLVSPEVLGKEILDGKKFPIGEDSFSYLNKAYNGFVEARRECLICNKTHSHIEVDSCKYSSPKIYLLIGESFNRHHSSLYGYPLSTNPELSQLDSLFVFTDVITSVNGTSYSFHNFMSLTSVEEDKSWSDSPMFMAYFKACGYYVTFYSNQFPKRFHSDSFDFEGSYFLDMPNVDSACFNYRNAETYQYDGELLDHYEEDRICLDKKERRLTIIHFLGQHMQPEDRYPSDYDYFSADSINRPDLNERQRQEIAYYDNATRYNDAMVKRVIDMYGNEDAIFIYFADHGDEANDFRVHRGRSFDIELGAPLLHCQMDIPFLIYATPLYRQHHPLIVSRIAQSVNRPFMTDDLPHLLLDLAGIYTPAFNPERSIINPLYNSIRKRYVGYDKKYDYDSICAQ